MQESRTADRAPVHYTMKTSSRHSPVLVPSHSRSNSQSFRAGRGSCPTTPVASPRMPYSVGQGYPPKLSPGRVPDNRAPSPNYFGLVVEPAHDPRDSSVMPRENWSPPSSSVRSFAAAFPKQVPLEANPDFEAFKRQADINRARGLGLSADDDPPPPPTTQPAARQRPVRWHTTTSDSASDHSVSRSSGSSTKEGEEIRMDVDRDVPHDSAYVSADSKRNSEISLAPPQILSLPRFASPRPVEALQRRSALSRVEDRDPRLSVMGHRADPPSPEPGRAHRAETVPATLESGPSMITPGQLRDMIEDPSADLLLLDIRSSQNYSQSRIQGALNLCIPTTLLKRATFNLAKLQKTFQRQDQQKRFSRWCDADCIAVYDSFSSEKRDAVTAMNMIKKFTNEGYGGNTCILRGGFCSFVEEYPELVDETCRDRSSSSSPASSIGGVGLAPVIGGVTLPAARNSPSPFFSNIRQNVDLADGVGQLDVAKPNGLVSSGLPRWLRDASETEDRGKRVSDKFLGIERDEQSRMKNAYAAFGQTTGLKDDEIQLSGIEKGGKNRYKDILPFEHTRVKLQGRPEGACDYVNASHIKASRSNKRYIASQAPLPTTFEDFWSVVWDQDVRVIVMLTAESEGGQLKCHQYWKAKDYGPIKLRLLSEKKVSLDIDKHRSDSTTTMATPGPAETGRRRANTTTTLPSLTPTPQPVPGPSEPAYVVISKLALSHAAHPFAPIREITHLLYPGWPDFGAPAQPSHLLGLVELANVMQRAALPIETAGITASGSPSDKRPIPWFDEPEDDSRARPMLVHCSAGCGRTGTFCTVDSVLDMLKRQMRARFLQATESKRDADGDVDMGNSDEAISPRTRHGPAPSFPSTSSLSRLQSHGIRRTPRQTPPIDTSWMEDDAVDLIEKSVRDFREQRISMVQSLRQFVLCYETVLEWIWRIQERSGQTSIGPRGRARSGSLQVRRGE